VIDLQGSTDSLRQALPSVPDVAVVLGSGLAALEHELTARVSISFRDVPGLPSTSVAGHDGRFVYGRLRGTEVLLQAGRIHAYEGHAPDVVVAPVRILSGLGVGTVLMTNAVGGIHPRLGPGDIVLIASRGRSSATSLAFPI
jgi:purine-nucleoside phosphorylase